VRPRCPMMRYVGTWSLISCPGCSAIDISGMKPGTRSVNKDSFSSFQASCILLEPTETFHTLFNIIETRLSRASLCLIPSVSLAVPHVNQCVICTLHASKPSQSTPLNHQTRHTSKPSQSTPLNHQTRYWLQLQQFSTLCAYLSFFQQL